MLLLLSACGGHAAHDFPGGSAGAAAPAGAGAGAQAGVSGAGQAGGIAGTAAGASAGNAGVGAVGEAGQVSAVPAMPGEYRIDVLDGSLAGPIFVHVTSATEAVVSHPAGTGTSTTLSSTFALAESSAALGVDANATSQLGLLGPLVLTAATDPDVGQIAVTEDSLGAFGSSGLVRYQSHQCVMEGWSNRSVSVSRDTEPTPVALWTEATPLGIVPWSGFAVNAAKPVAGVLSEQASVTLDGAPLAVSWSSVNPATTANGAFSDWASLVGKSVAVSVQALNTNGAATETIAFQLDVLDFGPPRSAALDFTQGAPADLLAWSANQLPAGSTCPNGCLDIEGGAAVRFAGPISGVHVRFRYDVTRMTRGSGVTVANTNGSGVQVPLPFPASDPVVDQNVMLSAPGDTFVLLRAIPAVMQSQTDPACDRSVSTSLFLELVEPIM